MCVKYFAILLFIVRWFCWNIVYFIMLWISKQIHKFFDTFLSENLYYSSISNEPISVAEFQKTFCNWRKVLLNGNRREVKNSDRIFSCFKNWPVLCSRVYKTLWFQFFAFAVWCRHHATIYRPPCIAHQNFPWVSLRNLTKTSLQFEN